MSKALEKIENLESLLNADLLQLSSGNNRMDDLRTMIGQIKVAIKKDKQVDYNRCIKRIEKYKPSHYIDFMSRSEIKEILKEELTTAK